MKTAVFCVCRNESKLLPLWFKYYSELFGAENVYVFDDNSTEKYDIDFVNYEMLNLGRDPNAERFGVHDYGTLWNFIINKYHELLKSYECVIHVDTDDFIIALPSLKDYIDIHKKLYFRCTAYEVLQGINEPALDWNRPVLEQRENWIRITNLDKTCIVTGSLELKGPGSWVIGNHYACGSPNEVSNKSLILVHLHRIDYENYKKKYFVQDKRIQNERDFIHLYGGYPLFWQKSVMDDYFNCPDANNRWEARPACIERIPEKYKGGF